jgi:4-hydroxy-3-polyprenylbenzoate decarboxylase
MNAVWGMGQMMYTKLIVIVDETVDVQNLSEVRDAVLHNVKGACNLLLSEGALDALDHSSNQALYGTRLGVDATYNNNSNVKTADDEEQRKVTDTYHILTVHKEKPGQGRTALEEYMKCNPDKFIIAVDAEVDPLDLSTVMWKVFNNIDAMRDLVLSGNKIGIDATKKWKEEGLARDWPNDIKMTDQMKQQVSERWSEYGFK